MGFCSFRRRSESCSSSDPAVVPPGLLICTITPLLEDFPRRSSASTRARSLRMRPVIVTRAIEAPGAPGNMAVPGARSAAAIATTRQIAARRAKMRQKESLRRMRRRSTMVSASSDIALVLLLHRLFALAPQRRPQNVAERRSGIRGAVLSDRLLFLGHFEGLDRDLDFVRAAVELGHPRVHLLSHRKTLRALLAAIAGKLRSLDERSEIGAD